MLNAVALNGMRGLEIGAGSGLCGIVAARQGANMLLTDVAEESLVIAHENAKMNGVSSAVAYRLLNWYSCDDFIEAEYQQFDLLIGSDVLFMGGAVKPVLRLITSLLRSGGRALIAGPGRANLESFEDLLYEAGFLPCIHILSNLEFAPGKIMKKFVVIDVQQGQQFGPAGNPFSQQVQAAVDRLRERHEVGAQRMDGYSYTI